MEERKLRTKATTEWEEDCGKVIITVDVPLNVKLADVYSQWKATMMGVGFNMGDFESRLDEREGVEYD